MKQTKWIAYDIFGFSCFSQLVSPICEFLFSIQKTPDILCQELKMASILPNKIGLTVGTP